MKEQPAMVYGAIDLHLRYSQIRIVDEAGTILCDRRVVTSVERLTHVFADRGPMRILLETGTESEWVAQALESAGHEVIVADANYAPMYGERTRRVRTDRRDVAALAEANRHGWYRATHRVSAVQRETRQILRSRRLLVQQRASIVSLIRALLRQSGDRLPSGSCDAIPARLARLTLPSVLTDTLAPLSRQAAMLTTEIRTIDARVRARVHADPVVARLQTVPGVGIVVATTFRACIDTVDRFKHAGQVSAALGLVPREDSSAERHHRGHITKAGPRELRALCIQAAWACWRSPGGTPLRPWVDRLAARRGKRIAVVALARRLSRIMYAVWRDGVPFDVTRFATA
jgi:transposase